MREDWKKCSSPKYRKENMNLAQFCHTDYESERE